MVMLGVTDQHGRAYSGENIFMERDCKKNREKCVKCRGIFSRTKKEGRATSINASFKH